MRRREFLLQFGAMTLGISANAQTVPLIGFLNSGSSDAYQENVVGFREGLTDAGYVVGMNVNIEYRWANGRYDHLPTFAAELLNRGISVLVATGGPQAALAAKGATKVVPIVFTSGADPVRVGLVSSVSRPGGNITGISLFMADLASKRLELWQEVLPHARKIALLINRESATAHVQISEIRAPVAGMTHEVFSAGTAFELTDVFAKLGASRVDALFVTSDPFFFSERTLITQLAARYSIPAIYEGREFVEAGGLMSYGTKIRDGYHQAGVYAGRILKGDNPNDMPVQQPTKFELLVNLRTAKALGLTIPPSLLARADEVIE